MDIMSRRLKAVSRWYVTNAWGLPNQLVVLDPVGDSVWSPDPHNIGLEQNDVKP